MAKRLYNFNPGPATLPLSVLKKAEGAIVDFLGLGMSILEISHRSGEFDGIMRDAEAGIREVANIPDNYKVLFLQGGASSQFFSVPMNLSPHGGSPAYINTGAWSKKAIKEAKNLHPGTRVLMDTESDGLFTSVPSTGEVKVPADTPYLHITSNNTIFGTQWAEFPDSGDVPLIVDMSSDIFSRKLDISKFGMIYAGAQKNLGPSGVTLVIIRDDLIERCPDSIPTMVKYKTHVAKGSMFNTPPVFSIFILKLVIDWMKENGGLGKMEEVNIKKGELLYGIMDEMQGFYRGTAEKNSRSLMNVTMRLPSEDLEKQFIAEAASAGFHGLKGHRSVGGIRVSMYNALPLEGIEKLVAFMGEFAGKNA